MNEILVVLQESDFLSLSAALLLSSIANIILGLSLVDKDSGNAFSIKRLGKGVLKALLVYVATCCTYGVGTFLPEMEMLNIDGIALTTQGAMTTIMIAAVVGYTVDAIKKLVKVFGVTKNIEDVK